MQMEANVGLLSLAPILYNLTGLPNSIDTDSRLAPQVQ